MFDNAHTITIVDRQLQVPQDKFSRQIQSAASSEQEANYAGLSTVLPGTFTRQNDTGDDPVVPYLTPFFGKNLQSWRISYKKMEARKTHLLGMRTPAGNTIVGFIYQRIMSVFLIIIGQGSNGYADHDEQLSWIKASSDCKAPHRPRVRLTSSDTCWWARKKGVDIEQADALNCSKHMKAMHIKAA